MRFVRPLPIPGYMNCMHVLGQMGEKDDVTVNRTDRTITNKIDLNRIAYMENPVKMLEFFCKSAT